MKRILTLVPLGGMCNRINSIMSGIEWSKNNPDTQFRVLWWKSHDLYAAFDELFMPIKDVSIKPMCSILKDRPATKWNLYLPKFCRRLFYDIDVSSSNNRLEFDSVIKEKKRIYVATTNSFCQYVVRNDIGSTFKPAIELQARIDDYIKNWNGDVVGVHVRRTDHAEAIKHSPLDNYYNKMDDELMRNPNTRFYLASDSDEVKEQMKSKYGAIILSQDFTLSRKSPQGMKDAVVELFTLASCNKIIGSDYSSYSLMAARINDIPFICCDSK